ncbi:helix-turn-helix domain-containing protein [Variovorax robiniae]|uniref:Helix-turn-helix domain-containing protein n=1 Tax=Variovorax robiniae TaxID=1836199 RepID=A0ABU8XJU6_9BURK
MTKYTEKQKLEAVEAYERGQGGLRAIAQAHAVGFDALRSWVAAHRNHGAAGIAAKMRKNYELEFKLLVLNRMRDDGLSCRQAAAIFGVRRHNQVAEWRRLFTLHGAAALQPGWKVQQTKMSRTPRRPKDQGVLPEDQRSRQELLRELQQLRMENAYLKKAQALVRVKTRSVPAKGR